MFSMQRLVIPQQVEIFAMLVLSRFHKGYFWGSDHRIMGLVRLENTSKIMESNCFPSTGKATTNACPQVPQQGF